MLKNYIIYLYFTRKLCFHRPPSVTYRCLQGQGVRGSSLARARGVQYKHARE
jgi:hypothetical protein